MVGEKKEMPEETLESLEGKFIVRLGGYGGFYYDGKRGYHSYFTEAKIYNKEEFLNYRNNDIRDELIFLDSEEGLRLLSKEIKNLEEYVSIYEPRVKKVKEGEFLSKEIKNLEEYVSIYEPRVKKAKEGLKRLCELPTD